MKLKAEKKIAKLMLDAAEAANDESLFLFGKEGVEMRQMDPSQIAMVSFSIPKSKFAEYSIEGEKELMMFSVRDVLKAVSRASDTVGMEKVGNKLQQGDGSKIFPAEINHLVDTQTREYVPEQRQERYYEQNLDYIKRKPAGKTKA